MERAATQPGLRQRLAGFIELLRPHNLLVIFLTTLIGYVVGEGSLTIGLGYAYASLAAVLVAAGGYVINDYYDIDTDSIAKPWRPIPSGKVSPSQAYRLAHILIAAGIGLSMPLGFAATVFVAVNSLLVYEYSRWIKRTGMLGNIVVAYNSAATILLGGMAASGEDVTELVLVPAFIAFLLVLAREIVKGIEDVEGDAVNCYLTLPVIAGPRKAAQTAAAMLTVVVVLSILPLFAGYGLPYAVLAGAVDALSAYSALLLLRSSDEELIKAAAKARRYLKIAFAVGALAFILGAVWRP